MTYLLHFYRTAVPILTIAVITAYFAGIGTKAQNIEARQLAESKALYAANAAYVAKHYRKRGLR